METRNKQLLSQAHAEFRRLRSGELGDVLRSHGIDYKVIWGVESYHLKGIAQRLLACEGMEESETRLWLAQTLWEEDVRESKMLATRLFPPELVTEEMTERLADGVKYTELADQLCMNLLARLPFAHRLVEQWLTQEGMRSYLASMIRKRLE